MGIRSPVSGSNRIRCSGVPHTKFLLDLNGQKWWKVDHGFHGPKFEGWHHHTFGGPKVPLDSWKGRMFDSYLRQAPKISRALLGGAILVDAFRMYEATEYAKETGDWSEVGREAGRIAGGWAEVIAGAKLGMMAGAPLGPVGVAVGGFIGGIVGGILGEA